MNKTAADGTLFVCCVCGRTSTTRYGFVAIAGGLKTESTASPGWDESCMLNAQEFSKAGLVWNKTRDRVVEVDSNDAATRQAAVDAECEARIVTLDSDPTTERLIAERSGK